MGHDFEDKAFIEMADRRAEWTLLLGAANAIRHTHPGLAALEQPQFPAFGQSQFEKLKENAKVFDRILQTQTWMAGPRFTIADITAFCTLEFARGLLKFSPAQEGLHALQNWRDRVNERDSARA
jgi:glutathione S-transferase